MKYNLRATIHTPVGVFIGNINGEPSSQVDLEKVRNAIQEHGVTNLSIYSDVAECRPVQSYFAEKVLSNSVIVFEIQPINE